MSFSNCRAACSALLEGYRRDRMPNEQNSRSISIRSAVGQKMYPSIRLSLCGSPPSATGVWGQHLVWSHGLMVSTWKPPCWVIRCHFPGQGNFKHTISHNVSALGKPRHKDTEDPREMTSMGLATIEHCRRREGINLPSKLANRTTKEQNGFNRFYIVLRSVPNKTT